MRELREYEEFVRFKRLKSERRERRASAYHLREDPYYNVARKHGTHDSSYTHDRSRQRSRNLLERGMDLIQSESEDDMPPVRKSHGRK